MIENLFTFVRTLGNQRIEGKKFFTTQIGVLGTLSDGTGAVGTAGKVLSSTGTGVEWVTVGSSNVADLDDLTDVIITTASTGQLLRFNGTSWVNWTPNFLTAYGSLNDLSDAVIATPTTGQLLRYNGTNWVNWTHNFLTTSSNLNDLANVSVAGPTNGQILRYNAGTSLWIADDETEPPIPTLQQVTTAGNTTTDGISAASFTATGFISGGNITGTKVTTPTVEFNGAISTNSVYQVDQGEPNPNVFYAKWNGDVQFTVNGDGYAIARTGYKVTGATGGFLKADGTIDTSTYLTSYTETQTLDAVTDLGNTTTNRITVGGVTISAGGDVTSPVIYSPTLWAVNGPIKIMADESGSLIPDQGDPANPVIYFEWKEDPLGHIDTDGKVTFNGFKTPSGTSSGFLKADGSIDTNTYLTSVAPYALDDLTDVSVGNPQDGEFLKYDDITGEWISAAIPTPTLDSVTTAGNTTANTIDVGGVTTPYVQFEEVATPLESHRSVNWGEDHNSLEVYYADEKHFDVGQDQMWYVKNRTEDTLPKGTVVMAAGAVGNSGKIAVAPLVADGTVSGRYAVGILMDDVRADEFGFAMTQGTIRGINTGEFTEGDTLYPDPLNPGALTNVEPASPALKLPIAFVVTSAQNGAIAVRMTQGLDLHEVHDVQITDGANGQLLRLQSGVWTNWTPNYLTAETDPVFTASAAATISTTNISNWNTAYGWGDHALAGYLTTYENNYISDVRISEFIVTFTGIGNAFNGDVDFSALPFALVTHNHAIAEITGLQTALDGKQPVGNYITTETDPTVPAHVKAITEENIIDWDKAYGWGNHADAGYATTGYVTTAIANLVDSAPATLDTLNELAAALGDDPNFATTVTNSIAGKVSKSGDTMTGALNIDYSNAYLYIRSAVSGSGVQWHDQMWLGRYDNVQTQLQFPNYLPGAAYGLHVTKSSDAFFAGLISRGEEYNDFNAVIAWGDDAGGDVLQYRFNNGVVATLSETGSFNASNLTINSAQVATQSWVTSQGYLTTYENNYISDVRLTESTLSFTGEGSAFTGDIDLSTLPFQPAGSYLTAEADTLATVTARGATTNGNIVINGEATIQNSGYLRLIAGDSQISGFTVFNAAQNGYLSNRITTSDHARGWGWEFTSNEATNDAGDVYFRVGYNGAVSYLNSGNFGIGTTNPLAKLDVVGHTYIRGGLLYVDTIAGYSAGAVSLAGSTNFIVPSGNVGIGTTNPVHKTEIRRLETVNRTTYTDILSINADANNAPYSGHGGGILFRGQTYSGSSNNNQGNRLWGRIGMYLNDSYDNFAGESMFFAVAPDDRSDDLRTAMTIKYDGNVGIGKTNPTYTLDIAGSLRTTGSITVDSGNQITLDQNYAVHGYLQFSAATFGGESAFGMYGYYGIALNTRQGAGVIIRGDSGNVGIGTTGPTYKLDVNGTGRFNGQLQTTQGGRTLFLGDGAFANHINVDSNVDFAFNYNNGNTGGFGFFGGGTVAKFFVSNSGVITAFEGNSTNWNTAYSWGNNYISDVRLSEYNLEFSGEGSAFSGTIDLSGLPFQPAGSYLTAEADTLASVTGRGASTTSTLTTTAQLGLYVNSGSASYIGMNSTSNWAYVSLLNNGSTTWDIGAYNGGTLEFRPYGGGNNVMYLGLDGSLSINSLNDGKLNLRVPSGDSSEWNYINFVGSNGVRDAYLGTDGGGTPTWWRDDNGVNITLGSSVLINGNTAWHSGNDGSGSGLDADLLDGVDSIYFVKGNGVNTLGYRTTNNSGANSAGGLSSGFYDGYNMSNMPTVDWYHLITNAHYNSSTSNQYEFHIATPFWSKNDFYMRSISPNDVGSWKRLWSSGDFSSTSVSNWNTAYSWGNHADAPYWNIELTDDIGVAASTVRFGGSVRIDGDIEVLGTITETSSIRFKENITPLDPALDKVNQLEAVSYNKIGVDDREIGLIAEEVAELFPEVVTYNEEGQPQGIQYQRLSVILLKAVQELSQEVNELKKKLN